MNNRKWPQPASYIITLPALFCSFPKAAKLCPIESFADFSADELQAIVALSDRTLLVLTLEQVAVEKLDVSSGLRIICQF